MTDLEAPLAPPFAVSLPPCPYPGLRPFEFNEWPIFFGRERMCDEVVAKLLGQPLLVVHGDSGCGKSSLIRAGVQPRLEQGAACTGARWRTCRLCPGDAPLDNLARALAAIERATPSQDDVLSLRRILNFGVDGLPQLAERIRRKEGAHLCILIDQFEELFTHARRQGLHEARLLIQLLMELHAHPIEGLYIVLTMRSEFLGACAQFPGFAEVVNATQYLLPRMSRADLVRAICEPALLYGGRVDLDLADRLIQDAGGTQDHLPIIQHGLTLLWREAAGTAGQASEGDLLPITLEHYRRRGGDPGRMLSDHADEVMQEALKAAPDHPRAVEDLFRTLTDINAEGHAIRRPQRLRDLGDIVGAPEAMVRAIIDRFRATGVSLLRPYGEEAIANDDWIDISHEALIRCWRRIVHPPDEWLTREFKNGLVWRSLLVQADSFEHDPTNVLSPATTEERETWMRRRNPAWCLRYGGGWDRVQNLIQASVAAAKREREEELAEKCRAAEAQWRERELREKSTLVHRLRIALGFALLFCITGIGLALWANSSRHRAIKAAMLEENARKEAVSAQMRAIQEAELAKEAKREAEAAQIETNQKLRALFDSKKAIEGIVTKLKTNAPHRPVALPAMKQKLALIRTNLEEQVKSLDQASRVRPRVYIHIADEGQRPAATRIQDMLKQASIGASTIEAPGVMLVAKGTSSSVIRCFGKEECGPEGRQLVDLINRQLSRPTVTLKDLSKDLPGVRPRQYELWFARGDLALKPGVGQAKKD